MESQSEIREFFKNQTIFITGGTGFIGKVLIEKLLRICYDLSLIYVLVRPKRNKSPNERIKEMFDYSCFDKLKTVYPDYYKKIHLISGDCNQVGLGLSSEDRNVLKKEVTVVIHAAANVKFDLDLRIAATSNLRAVRDILDLSKQMSQLKAFLYISTVFSNCNRSEINEEFYKPAMKANNLFKLLESIDEGVLTTVTPYITQKWPNTYTFTKCIAEDIIRKEANNLPVAIVRPGIIISTYEEPVAGWVDNYYGLIGIVVGILMGGIRNLFAKKDGVVYCIPCDFVANVILAATCDLAKKSGSNQLTLSSAKNEVGNVKIYNYVGSSKRRMTARLLKNSFDKYKWKYPLNNMFWFPFVNYVESELWFEIRLFFQHTLVAYIADLVLICLNKKPIAVRKAIQVNKLLKLFSYFGKKTLTISCNNVDNLWNGMKEVDRKLFNFNMDDFHWEHYWKNALKYGRVYLVKDPLETLPWARKKIMLFAILHYSLIVLFCCWLFMFIYRML
ncbi:unnamed protein product [Tenebrio molitor]|nr:unnamed protein product [Tenebrio molitor]